MPEQTAAEARAIATQASLREGRGTANHLVMEGAQARVDGTGGGSSYVQVLDPRAGQEGRSAGIIAAARSAGLFDPSFMPVPVFTTSPTGERVPVKVLTPGQVKVLRCAAMGLSYTETARALVLNVSTVKGHVGAYYKTLGVHSVPEAVVAAVKVGVLPLSFITGEDEPATPATTPRTQCTHEGCSKRTTHASGTCRAHR